MLTTIISLLNFWVYLPVLLNIQNNVPYIVRCNIEWATIWSCYLSGDCPLMLTFHQNIRRISLDVTGTSTVFELFQSYIKTKERCYIYNFVEQVRLYRLVYYSI